MHDNLITVMNLKEICIAIDSEFYEARELPHVVFGPIGSVLCLFSIFDLFHSSMILFLKREFATATGYRSARGLRSNSLF